MPAAPARVERIQFDGQTAYRKHAEAAPAAWRYIALRYLARSLGLSLAAPAPKPGGVHSLEIERARIAALRKLGANVPRVLAVDDTSHVLSNIGDRFRNALRNAGHDEKFDLVDHLLTAMMKLHRAGGYLSQAFLRNIMINEHGEIGFIDFEEDPGDVLAVESCQARDLLLVMMDLSDCVDFNDPGIREYLLRHLAEYPLDVTAPLAEDAVRLGRFLAIAGTLFPLREVRRLGCACRLLTMLDFSSATTENV